MKKLIFGLGASALAMAVFGLSACGDETTTNITEQTGMQIVAAGEKMDKCDGNNVGEMVFVTDSAAVFYCADGKWQTLNGKDDEKGDKGDAGVCGCDSLSMDEFIDERDGKVYRTTLIGKQLWMAENLNYADSAKTLELKSASWCYENKKEMCSKYGRLYTWNAAVKVCPEGWHLPSRFEYEVLVNEINPSFGYDHDMDSRAVGVGKYLKSKTGWENDANGLDSYGFNGLPAGHYFPENGEDFGSVGELARFWSSTESGGSSAFDLSLQYAWPDDELGNDAFVGVYYKNDARSVRCLKNSD